MIFLGLTSDPVPMSALDDYAETAVAPRISMVNGVSQVQVQGAQKYAVRVQVDPDKLQAQDIGINEVDQALQNWNVNLPTGQLFGPTQTFNIKAQWSVEERRRSSGRSSSPIGTAGPSGSNRSPRVIDGVEDNQSASWFYTPAGGTARDQPVGACRSRART